MAVRSGAISAQRSQTSTPILYCVGARHRTVQAKFRAVGIEPFPHHLRLALRGGDVDGAAMTITAGAAATAVERIAGARLETGSEGLAIVVAERAQHRPLNAGFVHRAPGLIEPLTKLRIHPADDIILERQTHARSRGRILPGEVAGRVARH